MYEITKCVWELTLKNSFRPSTLIHPRADSVFWSTQHVYAPLYGIRIIWACIFAIVPFCLRFAFEFFTLSFRDADALFVDKGGPALRTFAIGGG